MLKDVRVGHSRLYDFLTLVYDPRCSGGVEPRYAGAIGREEGAGVAFAENGTDSYEHRPHVAARIPAEIDHPAARIGAIHVGHRSRELILPAERPRRGEGVRHLDPRDLGGNDLRGERRA